jgi:1-acyl-sn-glycerol-3-phosphate acyltransferase
MGLTAISEYPRLTVRERSLSALHAHRSRLFQLFWPVMHYLIANLFGAASYVFFHILNRTIVIGKGNIPHQPRTLLLSNHQSMIDSFLIGVCAYCPAAFLRPFLIPWNPAAEENFYRNPILSWLADHWKCIPIKRGRKDLKAISKMAEGLRTSPLILFPEGTRSRSGHIGQGRLGAGLLILETWPTVIPVCIDGMDKVLPIGSFFPRIFKRIYVAYGQPLAFREFQGKRKCKETAQALMNKTMEAIGALRRGIEETKARRRPLAGICP